MTLHIISLGAGVQSTTLALMAAAGEIKPMPDCAIFADTRWEPKAVYEHLARLMEALPFPVHIVSAGNIRDDAMGRNNTTGHIFNAVPWFMLKTNGDKGIGRRQCTSEYKLKPIQRKTVELHGGKRPKGGTEMWLGISTNEAFRMKPSRVQYITNRWPLIELRMDRSDCKAWLKREGWEAPKSACIGCPYRSDDQWRALAPDEVADAIKVDNMIRHQPRGGQYFMHRSCKPLSEVDLRSDAEIGQADLFNNECEGMCGV